MRAWACSSKRIAERFSWTKSARCRCSCSPNFCECYKSARFRESEVRNRVLQEREVPRIGSSEPVPVDVRVIAASNADLLEAVANRRFREDLYYRLKVVALRMPPLRERASDILELTEHFLTKLAEQEGTERKYISREAMETLMRYSWPGNVRQLEHALESAVALSW